MTLTPLQDQYVTLYADCLPVSGACKAAIYDLTRQEIVRFPRVYLQILQQAQQHTLGQVLAHVADEASKQSVVAFLHCLLEHDFVHVSSDASTFPRINTRWDKPCVIQNAIIDINTTPHDYASLFRQLDTLGCEIVEMRCFSHLHTLQDLQDILQGAYHTSIQGVELFLKYDPRYADEAYLTLLESEPIIARLRVHSAPSHKELVTTFGCGSTTEASLRKTVVFLREPVTSHHHCGLIQLSTLSVPTTNIVSENQVYNGCLNRKIAIDEDGYIKNCPSMAQSFGHHKDVSLLRVAMDATFRHVWHIHKDQIKQCQDCEFRYVCTDCRAYVEDPQDILSKPLKCGYDPYTGRWEQWDRPPEKAWVVKHYELPQATGHTAHTHLSSTHTADAPGSGDVASR